MTRTELVQPLFQPGKVYPNCPGCKTAHLRAPGAPRPYKRLFFVAVVVLCNSLPTCALYPFVYFMVRDFHIAKRDEDIGFYVGWIGSVFMVGRCLTAVFWGQIADKYGRKPVMLAGVASVTVFNTLFGASTNFWMALLFRFLLGSFNAILGPLKAYTSEVCSDEHQALGVAVLGTMWGLGMVIGPAIGGYLSQPAVKYPTLFPQGSLFEQFPYLLPSLVCSAFAVVAFVIACYLPETIHVHEDEKQIVGKHESSAEAERADEGQTAAYQEGSAGNVAQAESKTKSSAPSLLGNRALMAIIIFYCIWSVQDQAFGEVFSLWCVSPRAFGGLNFTTTDVGNVQAGAGVALLVFQMFLFAPLANILGPIKVTRLSAMITIPLLVAYPLIFASNFTGILLKMSVMLVTIVKSILAVGALSGSFLLINNSVYANQRGAANGLSISVVSFFKIIGPAGGGSLFAWAQSRQSSFLPGSELVFVILGFVVLASVIWTFPPFLPQSLDKPKDEATMYTK